MANERETLRDWHRLFGLLLTDFFSGSPFAVEVERDLSQQQQLLDVVILRRGCGRFGSVLPDGLDGLAAHNLITFKSLREPLNDWAMKELIGHYVAYRKLVRPSRSKLLSEEKFGLFAVCAHYPHNLSRQVPWQKRQAGVYDCRWGTDEVRIVVTGELPHEVHNAPLHLFGASEESVRFGQGTYRPRSEDTSLLLRQLFEKYQREGFTMSYTMEDFKRDYYREHFAKLTPKQRREFLQSLSMEEQREALKHLSPERRRLLLESLPVAERLAGLPMAERLAGLPVAERLAGLSEEEIRQYLDQMNTGGPAKPRKKRQKK